MATKAGTKSIANFEFFSERHNLSQSGKSADQTASCSEVKTKHTIAIQISTEMVATVAFGDAEYRVSRGQAELDLSSEASSRILRHDSHRILSYGRERFLIVYLGQ